MTAILNVKYHHEKAFHRPSKRQNTKWLPHEDCKSTVWVRENCPRQIGVQKLLENASTKNLGYWTIVARVNPILDRGEMN